MSVTAPCTTTLCTTTLCTTALCTTALCPHAAPSFLLGTLCRSGGKGEKLYLRKAGEEQN